MVGSEISACVTRSDSLILEDVSYRMWKRLGHIPPSNAARSLRVYDPQESTERPSSHRSRRNTSGNYTERQNHISYTRHRRSMDHIRRDLSQSPSGLSSSHERSCAYPASLLNWGRILQTGGLERVFLSWCWCTPFSGMEILLL